MNALKHKDMLWDQMYDNMAQQLVQEFMRWKMYKVEITVGFIEGVMLQNLFLKC